MEALYGELATWWPLLSPAEDYADEAAFFAELLTAGSPTRSRTLLELGSGGGSNALHLSRHFAASTLTDLSPQMLAISRALNPDCEHVEGDMRMVRLGRTFDVVFVHDAIDYMKTRLDLARAIETAFTHCKPGGVALFVPDHVRETFEPSTAHGGHDGDGRALRYLEWSHDPDPEDALYTTEYVLVLREGDAPTRVVHETHVCGLFARAEWLALLRGAGFAPEIIRDAYARELFLARKPSAGTRGSAPNPV